MPKRSRKWLDSGDCAETIGDEMAAKTDHPIFSSCQPTDTNMTIWRYVNMPKLIDFLETKSLHFARVDTLDDPFEGSWTIRNKIANELQIREMLKEAGKIGNPLDYNADTFRSSFEESTRTQRQYTYVNCWHGGDDENAAMWKLYGTSSGSVAIQSTYQELVNAIPAKTVVDKDTVGPAHIGKVQYKNYMDGVDFITGGNAMAPFMCKRREFEHEKEVRAIVWAYGRMPNYYRKTGGDTPTGFKVGVNLDDLVDSIRVQPSAPSWVRQSIESIVGRYGLTDKVISSQIDTNPGVGPWVRTVSCGGFDRLAGLFLLEAIGAQVSQSRV